MKTTSYFSRVLLAAVLVCALVLTAFGGQDPDSMNEFEAAGAVLGGPPPGSGPGIRARPTQICTHSSWAPTKKGNAFLGPSIHGLTGFVVSTLFR